MSRTVEELERALQAAERRAAELQAWADASDADGEELRARVAELEAKPAAKGEDGRVAELQAWVDSSEAEAEQLRARVAELEAKPAAKGEDGRVAELQAWVDSSEAEAEQLRARVAELEAKPAPKEDHRVAELQAWVDSSEAEAEQLRARVAELEAKPAPKEDHRVAELQAWVDSSEAEAEQLRARVAELEAKPAAKGEDRRVAELQAWVDASEAEAEQLRARVAELEAKPAAKGEDHRVAELQAWVDSAEAEAQKLRERVAELEAKGEDHRVAELQAWVDSAEVEAGELRAQAARAEEELARVKSRFEVLGGSVGEGTQLASENRALVERLSQLESTNHSLRGLSTHLASQVESSVNRDVARLTEQLGEARAAGAQVRVVELETALSSAQEAVATLQVQREAAVDQVRRYVEGDTETAEKNLRALENKHRAERVASERQVAGLEAQLAEKVDEASVLQVRLKAHQAEQQKLEAEVTTLRERACAAEQALGSLASEFEVVRADKGTLEARSQDLSHKLEEAQRWLAQDELEATELQKQLEAVRTERAVLASAAAQSEATAARAPAVAVPPPPPADAAESAGHELEGFSAQHMHHLEALLAAEKVKTGLLERFASTAEASLRRMQDELDAAGGKLADMAKRLGLADSETGETLDRLDAARRELHALFGELAHTKDGSPADDSAELIEPEDVMEAPLSDLEAMATQQAAIAQEATQALAGEQRAREQLMGDLNWLKAELEKVSNVREDLRSRIGAMVQRELKRKHVVSALLDKLRSTEVAAAARAGTMRRLSAAMELAQRNAVRVQTVYFQKQIGSLQRQLETALNQRRPGVVRLVR